MDERQWLFEEIIMLTHLRNLSVFGVILLALTSALSAAEPTATPSVTNSNHSGTNGFRRVAVRFPKTEVKYPHGPDSERKDGVPRGKITDFDWTNSAVFPGTIRHCSLYVPA